MGPREVKASFSGFPWERRAAPRDFPRLPLVGFSREFPLHHGCDSGHGLLHMEISLRLPGERFPVFSSQKVLECRRVSLLPQKADCVQKTGLE